MQKMHNVGEVRKDAGEFTQFYPLSVPVDVPGHVQHTASNRRATITNPGAELRVHITRAAYTRAHPRADSFPLGYEAGVSAADWEDFVAQRAQEERDTWTASRR